VIDAGAVESLIDELAIAPLPDAEGILHVDAAIAEASRRRFRIPAARERYLMGQLMRDLIGRVDGRRLLDLLRGKLARPREAPEIWTRPPAAPAAEIHHG
jgi:hypothetical protein